jgi:hypothetical protein
VSRYDNEEQEDDGGNEKKDGSYFEVEDHAVLLGVDFILKVSLRVFQPVS